MKLHLFLVVSLVSCCNLLADSEDIPEATTKLTSEQLQSIGSAVDFLENNRTADLQVSEALTHLSDRELYELMDQWRVRTAEGSSAISSDEQRLASFERQSAKRGRLIIAEISKRLKSQRDVNRERPEFSLPDEMPADERAYLEARKHLMQAERANANMRHEMTPDQLEAHRQWRAEQRELVKKLGEERTTAAPQLSAEEQAYSLRRKVLLEQLKGVDDADEINTKLEEFSDREAQRAR